MGRAWSLPAGSHRFRRRRRRWRPGSSAVARLAAAARPARQNRRGRAVRGHPQWGARCCRRGQLSRGRCGQSLGCRQAVSRRRLCARAAAGRGRGIRLADRLRPRSARGLRGECLDPGGNRLCWWRGRQEVLAEAFLLTWDPTAKRLSQSPLPRLPAASTAGGAALVGGHVYVVAGQEGLGLDSATDRIWRLATEAIGTPAVRGPSRSSPPNTMALSTVST